MERLDTRPCDRAGCAGRRHLSGNLQTESRKGERQEYDCDVDICYCIVTIYELIIKGDE